MAHTREEVLEWLAEMEAGAIDLTVDNMGLASAAIALIDVGTEAGALPPDYLSPNFTLAEMTYSDTALAEGIDNTPDEAAVANLTRLALVMEEVRAICGGHLVTITSGYRCPELNAAVGGASNSAHLYGLACDFTIPGCGDSYAICKLLEPYMAELAIDQLINEDWVHLGLCAPPSVARCEALTLTAGGTYAAGFIQTVG